MKIEVKYLVEIEVLDQDFNIRDSEIVELCEMRFSPNNILLDSGILILSDLDLIDYKIIPDS